MCQHDCVGFHDASIVADYSVGSVPSAGKASECLRNEAAGRKVAKAEDLD